MRAGVDATTALTSMALCLVASALYGFSSHCTRNRLASGATPAEAWLAAAALAVLCTGTAYILYFRLIARVGATHAITVTYFVPVFAMLWAWLFLDERVGPRMLAGCAIVFVGVALATGRLGNAVQVRR